MTQSGVIVHYLRLVFWPHPLVADYDDWPVAHSIASVLPWVAIVIALLGATAWAAYRRNPLGFVGVWFFLILAPTSSVWPLVKEIAAERRMYLPLAAVIALVVVGGYAGLRQICGRAGRPALARLIGGIAVLAIVATLAQLTVWRNEDYRSTESFWRDVIVKRPGDVRARVNMGDYLYKRGRAGEALAQYAEAVRLRPSDGPSQYGLAVVLASQGKLDEAIAHYSESVRISPDDAQAHVGFGVALDRRGRLDEAIAQYSDAVRIDSNDADAHASLAATLVSAGKLHEAVAHYSDALRIAPSAWAHYNLATTLARDGKTREATQHLEAALKLNPGFAQARRALEELTSSSVR